MMKGKDPFKGMPSWKGKGKGDAKNKGGNNPFMSQPPQANVAQPASSSASQAPEKQETAHAEESWSYDYDTYWTDDWSGYESYYGYDGDCSQGDWYNWSYFCFRWGTDRIRGQAVRKCRRHFWGRTDRPDQPVLFFGHLLVPIFRTRTCRSLRIHASVPVSDVPVLVQIWTGSYLRASAKLRTVFLPELVTCIRSSRTHARSIPFSRRSVCISQLWSWCPTSIALWICGSWFSSDLCYPWFRLHQSHGIPLCHWSPCTSLPTASEAWSHLVFQVAMFK